MTKPAVKTEQKNNQSKKFSKMEKIQKFAKKKWKTIKTQKPEFLKDPAKRKEIRKTKFENKNIQAKAW